MTQVSEQLVRRIAERVIAQLAGPQAAPPALPQRADVRPPAGLCTADGGKSADRSDSTQSSNEKTASDRTFTGIITARQLADSGQTVFSLAPGARLTPLAVDYIREKKLTLHRLTSEAAAAGSVNTTWHWWIAGHCSAVQQLTGAMRSRLSPLSPTGQTAGLAKAILNLARLVRSGRSNGAVLFVHSAAQAACFANRCPSLRAVVGTCGEAVQQGIDQLAANVLIVEYPHQGPRAMRAMVEQFIHTARPSLPTIDRHLQELAQCV